MRQGNLSVQWRRVLCLLFCFLPLANTDAEDENTVRAFLAQRCYKCHGAEVQKADLQFDTLTLDLHNEDMLLTWQNIVDMLNLGLMPPYEEPQPELEELKPVVDWITATLKAHYDSEKSTGGQTVLRRLNRNEYRNTIRDLLHLDMTYFDPTKEFPVDDVEEGFDNIGRTLVMSDFLLTQYLNAADDILRKVNFDIKPPETKTYEYTHPIGRRQFNGLIGAAFRQKLKYDVLFERPRALANYIYPRKMRDGLPVSGIYRISILASAHNQKHPYGRGLTDANKPINMQIISMPKVLNIATIDEVGVVVGDFDMIADGKPRIYEVNARIDKGYIPRVTYSNGARLFKNNARRLLQKFHPELYVPEENIPEEFRLNAGHFYFDRLLKVYKGPSLIVHKYVIEGPFFDEWPSLMQKAVLGTILPDKANIKDVLTRFATRAYRRPVKAQDIEQVLKIADDVEKSGASREHAIKMGMKVILCSPNFLYLYENEGKLDDYALASKLSYFLWSSMPDDELLALAKKNQLNNPDVLRTQVDRMLKDDKAQAFVENFTERWLALYKIGEMPPDPRNFRIYYRLDLEEVIKKETHHFFKYILDNNLDIENFIDSDFTFVNKDLAALYRIKDIDSKAFQKVNLTGFQRGGLLGHASILTATSNGIETSPVVRGVWILESLLGTPPSPPPPDVEPLEPDIRGSTTIRELLANHRKIDTCNECHRHIDPLGFALENYNPVGAWRSRYGKGKPAIDPSDTMSDGKHFETLAEFKKILMEKKGQFAHCLTEKMLIYATGRTLEATDRLEIERIVHELKEQGYGLKDLVMLVATSEPFLTK